MFTPPSFQNTHPVIKRVLALSMVVTLVCLFFASVFPLAPMLFISSWGAKHGLIYQILTYPFVNSLVLQPLSLWSLLGAFFQYYIIFSIGTAFIYQRGAKAFLTLFIGSTLLVGLVGFTLLALVPSSATLITGLSYLITALLIWLAFHQPEAQIFIFFFPVKAKWAIFGLTAIYLFLDFSNGQFITFACTLTNFVYAYLYCVLSSEMVGPFRALHSFERWLIHVKRKAPNASIRSNSSSKIQNLYTTKKQIQKDLYLDLLLEKIAKQGKDSLTLKERWFLLRYSK